MSAEKPNPGDAAPQVGKLVQTTILSQSIYQIFVQSLYKLF